MNSTLLRDAVGALALGFAVGGVAAQTATGAAVTPELLLAAAGLGGGRAAWLIARGGVIPMGGLTGGYGAGSAFASLLFWYTHLSGAESTLPAGEIAKAFTAVAVVLLSLHAIDYYLGKKTSV